MTATALKITSADGTKLHGLRWEPASEPKADVLLCHGFAEHLGRYDHVAAALTAAGYRVTGLDLRGHGHSEGARGLVHRWDEYVQDMTACSDAIGGPHYIVAHSMGGNVALDWLRTHQALGAVVTGPFLGVAVRVPAIKAAAGKLLSKVLPWLTLKNELPASDVCTDPKVVAAYEADPLVFHTVTTRWFTEAEASFERILASAPSQQTDLLCMWGSGDKVVDLPAIKQLVDTWGGEVESQAWEGLYHEIFNEPVQDEVLARAVSWLDAKVAAG